MNNKRLAFTLVEIMIVVAIIGILCALAVPSFLKTRETTFSNMCLNNLRHLNAAKDMFSINAKKQAGFQPVWNDLQPYLKGHPACPSLGTYEIDIVGVACHCTFHTNLTSNPEPTP